MKRLFCIILCFSLLFGFAAASAAEPENLKRAVIGNDLNDEQISTVYGLFGIERGSVPELSLTNKEERECLGGFLDEELMGTNSISCVYIELLPEGSGLELQTHNLSWCTAEMFTNALVTVGIVDARVIVAAPFTVSGTAALAGIFKAYEDMTGTELDEDSKTTAVQEIIATGELADSIGAEDATGIISDIKLILNETEELSDDELKDRISIIADDYGIKLVDSQKDQLVTLCRGLEKLDGDALKEKVEYIRNTVEKISEAKEEISGILAFFKKIFTAVKDFFTKIFSYFE